MFENTQLFGGFGKGLFVCLAYGAMGSIMVKE
jgi:hypothetical protein